MYVRPRHLEPRRPTFGRRHCRVRDRGGDGGGHEERSGAPRDSVRRSHQRKGRRITIKVSSGRFCTVNDCECALSSL